MISMCWFCAAAGADAKTPVANTSAAGRILAEHKFRYMASTRDCGPCPLKSKCCPNTPQRIVPRDVNEDARDHVRALGGTPAFEKSRNNRKKVEMRFAHLKTHHRFERMRLRGLSGARDEFHLAAIVQNLKTLANHIWRPPPDATNAATASLSSSSCYPLKEGIAKTPAKAPGTR